MTSRILHAAPSVRAVFGAQLRAVGIALRPILAVAGTLIGVVAIIAGLAALRDGESIAFVPEFALLVDLAACVLPVAVWKGEYHIRRSYLASLPVDRSHHLLTKLVSGWVWLMALTAVFMLGMLVLALVTGGAVGVDEMRVLARDVPAGMAPEEAAVYARRWTTPGWRWAICFTTATVTYLLGSAVVLAGSHVRRWLVGVVVLILFCFLLVEQGFGFGSVGVWVVDGAQMVVLGPYGLLTLFGEAVSATVAEGELVLWSTPPTAGQWALTTLLWMSLALAVVLLVVARDRRG
jgi:hypothetical protein